MEQTCEIDMETVRQECSRRVSDVEKRLQITMMEKDSLKLSLHDAEMEVSRRQVVRWWIWWCINGVVIWNFNDDMQPVLTTTHTADAWHLRAIVCTEKSLRLRFEWLNSADAAVWRMFVLCYRSESLVTEKLLKEKEQIMAELMDEGLMFLPFTGLVLVIYLCTTAHSLHRSTCISP